jgi:hypothetical protein
MHHYPEIEKLREYREKNGIDISLLGERDSLLFIKFKSNKGTWDIYIQDEGGDFDESNQILCI